MSTISAYFIPATAFPIGQFEEKVSAALTALKIIDGYYDEEEKQYASGGIIAFEYAKINDSNNKILLPESSSQGYGSRCVHCKEEIDDEFYDVLNDFYDAESESGKEMPMDTLRIKCSKCKSSMTFADLKFDFPAALANQFFQFVDIDEEISKELQLQIQSKLGTDLSILYERM